MSACAFDAVPPDAHLQTQGPTQHATVACRQAEVLLNRSAPKFWQ